DGTMTNRLTPVRVQGLAHVTAIGAGTWHSLALQAEPASRQYRPRTEGLFAKIIHYRDPRNDYWEVRSKDGMVSRYGTPGATGHDPAVLADPGVPAQAKRFAWKLTRTIDPFGNLIEYSYARDKTAQEGVHQWDQLYLSQIRYVDYGDPLNPSFLVTL